MNGTSFKKNDTVEVASEDIVGTWWDAKIIKTFPNSRRYRVIWNGYKTPETVCASRVRRTSQMNWNPKDIGIGSDVIVKFKRHWKRPHLRRKGYWYAANVISVFHRTDPTLSRE